MDAQVTIAGHVGTAVEFREGENGGAWASFRLAQTPRVFREGQWADAETLWMSVSCYKQLAENVRASINKGDAVVVTGKLRAKSWTDKRTGELVTRSVLVASSVGHDLNRGVTSFTKRERVTATAADREAETLAAVDHDDPNDDEAYEQNGQELSVVREPVGV